MTAPIRADDLIRQLVPADALRIPARPPAPAPMGVRGVSTPMPKRDWQDATEGRPAENWIESVAKDLFTPVKERLLSLRRPGGKASMSMNDIINTVADASSPMGSIEKVANPAKLISLLKKNGGFTINARTGKALTEGFSVGAGNATGKLLKVPVEELTEAAFRKWARSLPADQKIGGWIDDGFAYLEPITHLSDEAAAIRLGAARGELGVGNLAKYAKGENGYIPSPAPEMIDGVAQKDLPRFVPPTGAPKNVVKAIKANTGRVEEAARKGLDMGAGDWWHMNSVRQGMVGADPAGGAQRFDRLMEMLGATSPRSTPPQNALRSIAFEDMIRQGKPIPRTNAEIARVLGPGYGHLAHLSQLPAVKDVEAFGTIAPTTEHALARPKTASMAANLKGNLRPVTIDTHNLRSWGLGPESQKAGYHVLEPAQQELAYKMGIQPAEFQSAVWAGDASRTGVAGDAALPMSQIIRDQVTRRARAQGVDPTLAYQLFLKGQPF